MVKEECDSHVASHTVIGIMQVSCHSRSEHLKIHERIQTDGIPFSCSKCDKKFGQAGNLRTHEKFHSSGDKHEREGAYFKNERSGER